MKKKFLFLNFALFLCAFSSVLAEDRLGLSTLFIQLLNDNKTASNAGNYQISEKGGVKTLIQKDQYGSQWNYVFDRKNWFLGMNFTSDVSITLGSAGMYFKPDGTQIIGVGIIDDKFGGPAQRTTEVLFEEFSCDVLKGQVCPGKNVTAEIFPQFAVSDFVATDARSQSEFDKRPGEKLIRYEIPRSGTNVTASLWLYAAAGDSAILKNDHKLLQYTHCSIGWVKKEAKFRKGKCSKKINDALYYGN